MFLKKIGLLTAFFIAFIFPQVIHAALDLELTQGVDSAIPIAVVPFVGDDNRLNLSTDVADIIMKNLRNSGRFAVMDEQHIAQFPTTEEAVDFDYWREQQVEYLVVGDIVSAGLNRYRVTFSLMNVSKQQKQPLVSQEFTVTGTNMRGLAHHISDVIYEELMGVPGIFSTSLAYIVVSHANNSTQHRLEVADADGHSPQALVVSSSPLMSPAWSPDGKKIAYVSFENRKAEIYTVDISSGRRDLITSFPGINGAPAWSPDSTKLAVVLSKDGSPNIYVVDVITKHLRQITNGWSISTEPAWSPDGKSIIFTSDRGGSPQIYRVSLESGETERVTFAGRYNASASYSSDGNALVLLHNNHGLFNIAMYDLQTGTIRTLTQSGLTESPTLAPNDSMILYATQYGGRGVLGLVSTDGRVQLRLPARDGDVQEPTWSPYRH